MLEQSVPGKVYSIWIKSRSFAFLQVIFAAFSRGFEHSRIKGFFLRESRVDGLYADSLFAGIFKALHDFIYRLIGKIGGAVGRAAGGGVTWSLADRCGESSVLLNFETLLGGFICLMFIIPHSRWSNTYALLASVGLCGLYFILVGLGRRRPYYLHQLGLPLLLFAIACVFGVISSLDRSDSLRVFTFFLTSFLLMYVICADIDSRERLMKLLGFIYVAVILTSLYAVMQRFMGVDVSESFTDIYVNKGVPGRVYSTLDNPNNFAEFLVLMTPLAAVFAGNVKRPVLRVLCCSSVLVAFLALLMTYARANWISMLVASILFVYYANKRILPAFLLVMVAAFPFLPDSVMIRIASIFNSQDSSISFRFLIWGATTEIARDYFFTGIGLGPSALTGIYHNYAHRDAWVGVAHSHMVYLELIIEMGILGFITFMWYMLRMWKDTAVSIYRQRSPLVRLTLAACVSSLIGIAFTFAVEYVWYYPRTMFAYFIVMAIAWAAVSMTRAEEAV